MFEKGARLLGHPVHQMLIVFPLGLLATSVGFDLIAFSTGDGKWAEMAFWMIAAGLIGGLAAGVFGLIDWLAVPSGTRAKAIGAWHGIGNVVVLALFAVGWFGRLHAPADLPSGMFTWSVVGVVLALVTGWLGGELVDRLGIGVDKGANADSPSSLSGRPASERVSPPPPGSMRGMPG